MNVPRYVPHTALPAGYVPYQLWPEYAALKHNFPPLFHAAEIPGTPPGVRRGIWPLILEEYTSDIEPTIARDLGAPNRCVMWNRIARHTIPPGWFQLSPRPSRLQSFIVLDKNKDYSATWSKIARNERARWQRLQATTYCIETVAWEEFEALFRRTSTGKKIGLHYAHVFRNKQREDPTNFILYGVRRLQDNMLVAGIGVVHSPTFRSSLYDLGCKLASVQDPVMVGLIDHWFSVSQKTGIQYIQLGGFWVPGKPKSWKGFSTFKAKFKPQYILFPPTLYKLVRGKLW